MTTLPRQRVGWQRSASALLAGALVAAVACAGPEVEPPDGRASGAVDTLLLTCGGPAFPRQALSGPVGAEGLDDPAAEALRALLNEPGIDPALLPDAGWRLVNRDATSAIFIADSEAGAAAIEAGEPPLWVVTVSSSDGRWHSDGFGQCRPQVVLGGGVHPGRWGLDPDAPPPGPDATRLAVIVEEIQCSSGRPPGDRVLEPLVDYAADSITIVAPVRDLPPGGYDCQGAPGTPAVFELAEPLGGRELLDGDEFPPRPPELLFAPP